MLWIKRQNGFAEHAAVGLAQQFRWFSAFRTLDNRSAGGHHSCPEINSHARQHSDGSDKHERNGHNFTCRTPIKDDSRQADNH